ncbi:MAG: phosphoribosylglycinamide formyltransferase [Chloroflexi bacterium]|nr:phosphoribosylglycinamide formyltransferase [Chloroflexota bacterium]
MKGAELRLGILASHGGTNLQAIMDACSRGGLDASVAVVISNNSGSRAIQRARAVSIPAYHISGVHPQPPREDGAILDALQKHHVDLVVLTGYMKLLGPKTLAGYRNRVLNSHPALLPGFGGKGMYGTQVHEEVLKAGDKVTGVTIHLVDDQYDHGAPVAQCTVPVLPDDTAAVLEERVKERERRFWVEVLQKIAHCEINLDALADSSLKATGEVR